MATRRIAWLAEEDEGDDGRDPCTWWATATFSGHVESAGAPTGARLHAAVPLPDAIAWARDVADLAVVHVAGHQDRYWHGDRPPPKSWGLTALPDAVLALPRRRMPGLAWCDRTLRDPAIEWPANVSLWVLRASRTTALGKRLVDALEAIAGVKSARRVPVPGAGQMGYTERLPLTVRAVIEAPTREEAHRCLHAAAAQVGATLPAGATADVWVGAPLIDERDGGPNRAVGERWGLLA